MNTRRLLLALVALLLVFIILGTSAVGAVIWLAARSQAGQGQLLVMGDSRLSLVSPRGEPQVLSEETTSEGFLYPVPSPDGTQVAFVTSGADGTRLFALSLQSGERKELWSAPQPLQLFYMNWSPDSSHLSFLTPTRVGGLGVFIVRADGSAEAQLVAGAREGAYFAWTPDSRSLLLHLNGSVFDQGTLATFALGGEQKIVSDSPGLFQAPAWSADGSQLFYVAQPAVASAQPTVDDVESVLTRAAPDGSGATELAREKSAYLFFSRAPGSDLLAYTSFQLQQGRFGPLQVVDGRTGERRTLSRDGEGVVAFFWSPDGERIAYLTREQDRNPNTPHTWHLVAANGGEVRDLASFTPSPSFIGLLSFFDAYAHSFTIWSADSHMLAYAANDGIYTLETASGATTRIADGELGVWVRPARR